MPAYVRVNPGDPMQAAQLNQVIDSLTGAVGKGVPLAVTAVNDATNYALADSERRRDQLARAPGAEAGRHESHSRLTRTVWCLRWRMARCRMPHLDPTRPGPIC